MSAFKNIKICGADINEFSIYTEDCSANEKGKIKTSLVAEELAAKTGAALGAEGKKIILSAASTDVSAYSVKVENGNVIICGSYISIDSAVKEFLACDSLSEGDSLEGKMALGVPYTKADVLDYFKEADADGCMPLSGTRAFGSWGEGAQIAECRELCEKKAGYCVGIIEIDPAKYGDTLSALDVSMMVSEGAQFINDGGIVSISPYFKNPFKGAMNDEKMNEAFTKGSALYADLRKALEPTLRVIKAYADNGLPFIFRPFPEMNTGKFWWCETQGEDVTLSAETMIRMWKTVYDIVTDELSAKDAIWVYSLGIVSDDPAAENVTASYPGDEYVDVIGCDWVTEGYFSNSIKGIVNGTLDQGKEKATGKPCAMPLFAPSTSENSKLVKRNEAGEVTGYTFDGYVILDMLNWMRVCKKYHYCYFILSSDCSVFNMKCGQDLLEHGAVYKLEDLKERWEKLGK